MSNQNLVRRYRVVKATVTATKASLSFTPIALLRDGHKSTANTRVDGLLALKLVQESPKQFTFGRGNTLSIIFPPNDEMTLPKLYRLTEETLRNIRHNQHEQ